MCARIFLLSVLSLVCQSANGFCQDAIQRYKSHYAQPVSAPAYDFGRDIKSGEYRIFLPDRFGRRGQNDVERDGLLWQLWKKFEQMGAIQIDYEDHSCVKMYEKGFYARECIMHDKTEIGSARITLKDPERLKVQLIARLENRFIQIERFRCPDGECVYAYFSQTTILAEGAKAYCQFTAVCKLAERPHYYQIVRLISDASPPDWRIVTRRLNADGPFLDEWTALKALRIGSP